MRPHRRQPTRLPCLWDSPGKNTGVGCHFLLQCMKVKSESEVAQSCPTLCDPMDCSLPGSSVHGISQARVVEWGATAFSLSMAGSFLFFRSWFKCHFSDRSFLTMFLQLYYIAFSNVFTLWHLHSLRLLQLFVFYFGNVSSSRKG